MLAARPLAAHVLVVEDDPRILRAVAGAFGVPPRPIGPVDLEPATIAFDHDLPFTTVRGLTAQLLALTNGAPASVYVADVAALVAQCEADAVPVFHLAPSASQHLQAVGAVPRRARVLLLDLTTTPAWGLPSHMSGTRRAVRA